MVLCLIRQGHYYRLTFHRSFSLVHSQLQLQTINISLIYNSIPNNPVVTASNLTNTGLFETIVGVLTTCHTQYT